MYIDLVIFKVILGCFRAIVSNLIPSNICERFASVLRTAVVKQSAKIVGSLVCFGTNPMGAKCQTPTPPTNRSQSFKTFPKMSSRWCLQHYIFENLKFAIVPYGETPNLNYLEYEQA